MRWRRKRQQPAGAGVRAGPGAGRGAGAGARSDRAGPVSAAPCPQRGRRQARGARQPGGAAPPSWPGGSGLGCAGLWARGGRRRPGQGRRRRRRLEARPTGKAGEAVSASPGRSGGETSSSCPARWCTSLSCSLAHSLTSWLEIPTDVEREDRQTDTGAHAAGAGGGVAAGGGESPHLWRRPAPPVRPGGAARLPPLAAAA